VKPLGDAAKEREKRAEHYLEHDISDEAQDSTLGHVHLVLGPASGVEWIFTMSTTVLAIVLSKICSMLLHCSHEKHERRDITRMLYRRERGQIGLLTRRYFAT
jgi:hypothetical protein